MFVNINSICYTANKWEHKTKLNFRYYMTPIKEIIHCHMTNLDLVIWSLMLLPTRLTMLISYGIWCVIITYLRSRHDSSYKIPYTRAYRRYDLLTLCLVIVVYLYHVQHCICHYRCLSQYYNVLALFQEKYDTTKIDTEYVVFLVCSKIQDRA